MHKIFICLVATLFLSACGQEQQSELKIVQVQGQTMGTFYKVAVYGDTKFDEKSLNELAQNSFKKVIDAINTFGDSELYRFNKEENTNLFPISDYLANVLEESRRHSLRLGGAMDFSVGPLVNLWGFGPESRPTKIPSQEQIDEVKNYVGNDKYEIIRDNTGQAYLKKNDPRVKLDLSTIGEGLGVDLLASNLIVNGVTNFLVSVAGANKTFGKNAKGEDFKIGIEDPKLGQGSGVYAIVCPQGNAMSTAGSYRNFYEENGKRFSHVIDPKTGRPIDHRTVSVTVIAKNALDTDAMDTGLLVLGADKALDWAERHGEAIYVIEVDKDGKLVSRHSRAFEQYLKCK